MEDQVIDETLRRVISDLAYGCFAVISLAVLVPASMEVLPVRWDDSTAAGWGFFVLIPLAMLYGLLTLAGIGFSILLWRDWRLPALAATTVAFPVLLFMADESAWISPASMALIAVLYLGFSSYCTARWFFSARWRDRSQQ